MSASLSRLAQWWTGRTDRERWMLRGLAFALGLTAFWFALLVPAMNLDRAAREDHRSAAAALAEAQALAAEIAGAERSRGAASVADLSQLAKRTSAEAGVSIAREQAGADGSLSVWTAAGPARPALGWIASLQRDHGVGVGGFEAQRAEAGGVEVRIVLTGAGG